MNKQEFNKWMATLQKINKKDKKMLAKNEIIIDVFSSLTNIIQENWDDKPLNDGRGLNRKVV